MTPFTADLRKAIGMVCRSLLLVKLTHFRIGSSAVKLLHGYPLDRSNYVNADRQTSSMYKATTGVPKDSVLEPLPFKIFVNDGSSAIRNSFFRLCADEIKILKEIQSVGDCRILSSDLLSFSERCIINHLTCTKTVLVVEED